MISHLKLRLAASVFTLVAVLHATHAHRPVSAPAAALDRFLQ